MKQVILVACMLTCMATAAATGPGVVSAEFIYETAPFPECHASTIVETGGRFLAAWFGGTEEKAKDVGIWTATRGVHGWSEPKEVANGVQADGTRHPSWNPVLFQPQGGPLLLFYKVGPSPSKWWGMLITSKDHGVTWSEPQRLPAGVIGPVKNKPIQLPSGELLCPSSTEHDGWRVHFERTANYGKSWDISAPVNDGRKLGAIQPSILDHGSDRLQAIGRTRQKRIFETWSEDGGKTWGEMALLDLPNPNAGTDAVTLTDKRHLLVYNHTPSGRSPLNVAVSRDGRQWQAVCVLESEPGEYSYPAVIQALDGHVHVTYTWKRKRIKYVVLDPQKFELKQIVKGQWPDAQSH